MAGYGFLFIQGMNDEHIHAFKKNDLSLILGGSNTDRVPSSVNDLDELVLATALTSGAIAVELNMIPNQPMSFYDSPTVRRSEGNLINNFTFLFFWCFRFLSFSLSLSLNSYAILDAIIAWTVRIHKKQKKKCFFYN